MNHIEYEWILDLGVNPNQLEFSVTTRKFLDTDGKWKLGIKVSLQNNNVSQDRLTEPEMPCSGPRSEQQGYPALLPPPPKIPMMIITKVQEGRGTRELMLRVLKLTMGGAYGTLVLRLMASIQPQHMQTPLRRPRAIQNNPVDDRPRNDRPPEETEIRPKVVNSVNTNKPKSKYSKEDHRRMGQELEEYCFMFEFNARYLHLRDLYVKYQKINKEIDDWTREKKKYSRYTSQGKKEKWRINSEHIRPLEQDRHDI